MRFIYFDLGNVVLHFTVERMCRQMGEVACLMPEEIRRVVFDGPLEQQYEMGQITSAEFYEAFCRATSTRPDQEALRRAGADIFSLNASMLPVIAQLRQAGYRLGILSNTCEAHWEHCFDRFRILREGFDVYALSYCIRAVKPQPAIFQAAAQLAGVKPREIFFTDDIAGHVAAARAAGFDAVPYTDTPLLVEELRRRGVRFNY